MGVQGTISLVRQNRSISIERLGPFDSIVNIMWPVHGGMGVITDTGFDSGSDGDSDVNSD